jgi:hypothetical protein
MEAHHELFPRWAAALAESKLLLDREAAYEAGLEASSAEAICIYARIKCELPLTSNIYTLLFYTYAQRPRTELAQLSQLRLVYCDSHAEVGWKTRFPCHFRSYRFTPPSPPPARLPIRYNCSVFLKGVRNLLPLYGGIEVLNALPIS